jgi:hypothetical protein
VEPLLVSLLLADAGVQEARGLGGCSAGSHLVPAFHRFGSFVFRLCAEMVRFVSLIQGLLGAWPGHPARWPWLSGLYDRYGILLVPTHKDHSSLRISIVARMKVLIFCAETEILRGCFVDAKTSGRWRLYRLS